MLAYNETALYIEDWIGLKTLDEAGKLYFLTSPGGHLQFTHKFFFDVVDKYFKYWCEKQLNQLTKNARIRNLHEVFNQIDFDKNQILT